MTNINKDWYYYVIYKITNLKNWKYYIWAHKTKNLNDWYMWSWILINKSIKKYWINNFKKEILMFCKNEKKMYEMEKKIVNEELVKDKNSYNLKVWWEWWFDFVNNI